VNEHVINLKPRNDTPSQHEKIDIPALHRQPAYSGSSL